MSKKVVVTKAQQDAANAIVRRSAVTGRQVRSSVSKIAHAPVTSVKRSARTASSATPRSA